MQSMSQDPFENAKSKKALGKDSMDSDLSEQERAFAMYDGRDRMETEAPLHEGAQTDRPMLTDEFTDYQQSSRVENQSSLQFQQSSSRHPSTDQYGEDVSISSRGYGEEDYGEESYYSDEQGPSEDPSEDSERHGNPVRRYDGQDQSFNDNSGIEMSNFTN